MMGRRKNRSRRDQWNGSRRSSRRSNNRWNGSRRSSWKGNGRLIEVGPRMSPSPSLATQKDGRILYNVKKPEDYPSKPRAPFPMCFTQEALDTMMRTVGRQHPETGAKGFSPFDHFGFDVVEYDVEGSRSATSGIYGPDEMWGEERQDFHLDAEDPREWSGDIHSHPGNSGTPSPPDWPGSPNGDLGYVRAVFAANESMQYFLMPIITHGPYVGDRERNLGKTVAWIHPWIIERGREDEPMIAEVRVREVSKFPERRYNPEWDGDPNHAAEFSGCGWHPGWEAVVEAGAVRTVRPRTMTDHAHKEEFRKRLGDAVSENFHRSGIMVVGVGAGSYMVEKLARMSPASISLCDPDVVEISNLARTSYELGDVGSAKVDAMVKRIQRINPSLTLKACAERIQELGDSDLEEMFEGVGVVVAGTDNFEAQAFLNRECVRRGIPVMFIGIHDRGEGGRIRWVVPGGPCYRCIDPYRYEDAEVDGEALDLDGANGSIVDCQLIDSFALKICVALLEIGQKSGSGSFYDSLDGKSDLVVINSEDYEWGQSLMDAVFASEEANAQKALNEARVFFEPLGTLLLSNESDDDCPVCGKNADSSAEGLPSPSSKSQRVDGSI